jgi:hypothetical protein
MLQTPLSVLSSVVVVCKLTHDLFLEKGVDDVSVGDHGAAIGLAP